MVMTTLEHHRQLDADADEAYLSLSHSKDKFIEESRSSTSSSRKKKRNKPHALSWKNRGNWSEKCTNDLHRLIDEKDLNWSKNRTLPVFNAKKDNAGGVIVFFHVAKTGGKNLDSDILPLPTPSDVLTFFVCILY